MARMATSTGSGRVLRLLGLGVRSRGVVVGVEQVRDAVKKGRATLVIMASDASPHSRAKVLPLLQARGVKFVEGATATELGGAVGKEKTAAVGVVDPQLANGIRQILGPHAGCNSEEGV